MSALMLLAALLAGAAGCEGPPETLVGSDVPQIVGLENRHLSGLQRDGDRLVGARALFRGEMVDPEPVAQRTIARFESRGWTLRERRISTTTATLLFTKDDREVEVDLKASQLNPAMGVGSLDLRRQAGGSAAPGAGGVTGRDGAARAGDAAPAPSASASGGRS